MRQAAGRRRVAGHHRQHIVVRQDGGQVAVDPRIDAIHVNEIGVEQQHERGLHHAGMLQIPAGEPIGVQRVDGGIVHEIPVGQKLYLHIGDAIGAGFLQSQLGPFEDELVVLVVAVHEHDLAGAVLDEVVADIPRQRDERRAGQRCGARQVEAAAAALLGAIAEVDRGAHHAFHRPLGVGHQRLGRGAGHGLGERGVHAHGHVAAMLLQGADGDEHNRFLGELVPIGERIHFFHVHRVLHEILLSETVRGPAPGTGPAKTTGWDGML